MEMGKSKVVKVEFRAVKDLPEGVIKANKLEKQKFVEIRVENSEPTIKIESISSPADRIRQKIKESGITLDF